MEIQNNFKSLCKCAGVNFWVEIYIINRLHVRKKSQNEQKNKTRHRYENFDGKLQMKNIRFHKIYNFNENENDFQLKVTDLFSQYISLEHL